jgi:hypothetical protein
VMMEILLPEMGAILHALLKLDGHVLEDQC